MKYKIVYSEIKNVYSNKRWRSKKCINACKIQQDMIK